MYLLAICMSSLEKCQFSSLTHSFIQFSSVQSLSHVWLFATPWITACKASLSNTNSWSPPKLMSIESVMPSNHLILWHPLLFLPSILPNIRVFSNESALRIRWPKYWSFSFNIRPSMNTQDWYPLGWTGWISLQSKGLSRVFSNTTVQKHQFFSAQLYFLIGSIIFLELSCRSCLCIFEINALSVASFAISFSHSEGCLFTLLIVSFVVQKLLSFIRSHLFTFAFISITLGGGS